MADTSAADSSNLPKNDRVKLLVGERAFNTSIETLTNECDYFTSYFSGRWETKYESDGSLFFDWNGDTFEHILDYQRALWRTRHEWNET